MARVVSAAMFVELMMAGAGLRTLQVFLRFAGLVRFSANSFGAHERRAARMDKLMLRFERNQRRKLAASMERKSMSLAPDETFFPETCLVAMEPDSGFILVEKFAAKRDVEHWRHAVRKG